METNQMTPTQIDTIILEQSWQWQRNLAFAMHTLDYIANAVGRTRSSYTSRFTLHPTEERKMTTKEIIDFAEAKFAESKAERGYEVFLQNSCHIDRNTLDSFYKYKKSASEASAIVDAMNDEFDKRGGWTRFYLVASSNGHIHSSTACHTCNKGKNPTQFALVPSLSGTSVEDAVAKLGHALCSVCFPEAPVEYREQVKFSKALATVLMEKGEEAFDTAMAKAEARKRKAAK